MQPILTPEEMAAVDASAAEPVDVLVGRAASYVARAAVGLLGGTYGRRVVVLAGKGNNGEDGRVAAQRLRRRGVRVAVVDAGDPPARLPQADLVIDAAYGTGFRGSYSPPEIDPTAPVLAVDIPSGVDGLSGQVAGSALQADLTITFAALKPGLVLHPGARLAGRVHVADIGLDVSAARAHRLEFDDVAEWLPRRAATAHKWNSAVHVVGGSPGMNGAAHLASLGALRGGAGYVRLSTPGQLPHGPLEAVAATLPSSGWSEEVVSGSGRFKVLAVGPGLGRGPEVGAEVGQVVTRWPGPVVVDGDGLWALGRDVGSIVGARAADEGPVILTPHDGEYEMLTGARPGQDRLAAARDLATASGSVVLLKGACTVVADPSGATLVSDVGPASLATAGAGDVLTGLVAALMADGREPMRAAAGAAYLHGMAARRGPAVGLVAHDVADALPQVLSRVGADRDGAQTHAGLSGP